MRSGRLRVGGDGEGFEQFGDVGFVRLRVVGGDVLGCDGAGVTLKRRLDGDQSLGKRFGPRLLFDLGGGLLRGGCFLSSPAKAVCIAPPCLPCFGSWEKEKVSALEARNQSAHLFTSDSLSP